MEYLVAWNFDRMLHGGGKMAMVERIIKIKKSDRKGKKYCAIVQDKRTKKTRKIHFGALGYEQYKDSTKLKLYSKGDHGDSRRRENYFSRHSGVKTKEKALEIEKRKSNGKYNAKILSHVYLW